MLCDVLCDAMVNLVIGYNTIILGFSVFEVIRLFEENSVFVEYV